MEPKLKTPKGVENKTGKDGYFPNGNFTFTENFTSPQLDYRWIGLRGPREEFISVLKDGGLQITPFPGEHKRGEAYFDPLLQTAT